MGRRLNYFLKFSEDGWIAVNSTATPVTQITDYVNGVEYKNSVTNRIANAEGQITRTASGAYQREYDLRDHLGNTRVTFCDLNNDGLVNDAEILQSNNYYAFGLNMEMNTNGAKGNNKYQYNGKEWNDDFGLGLNDYGARMYDPAIGRWNGVDPLAEKYMRWSPYTYTLDNPLKFIDPDGMKVINGDEAAKNRAEKAYNSQKSSFDNNYKGDKSMKSDKFGSKADYKAYKEARSNLDKAEKAYKTANENYQNTQRRIDDVKSKTPEAFAKIDNLKYKDAKGEERNLDVVVKTTETLTGDNFGGETALGLNDSRIITGRLDQVIVRVTISSRDNTLSHEFGHVWDRVMNETGEMRTFSGKNSITEIQDECSKGFNCRVDLNNDRVQVAREWEKAFDKKN